MAVGTLEYTPLSVKLAVSVEIRMKSKLRRLLLAALALSSMAGIGAGAADVSTEDASAIRTVIEAQLAALSAGDALLAFSYASASIRAQFRDASSFMTMVRQGYPMLIRPLETFFLRPRTVDGSVFQTVRLRDQDARPWRAIYHLQQQPDRSWRINGCAVEPDDESPSAKKGGPSPPLDKARA
jgi:hypothetical protein